MTMKEDIINQIMDIVSHKREYSVDKDGNIHLYHEIDIAEENNKPENKMVGRAIACEFSHPKFSLFYTTDTNIPADSLRRTYYLKLKNHKMIEVKSFEQPNKDVGVYLINGELYWGNVYIKDFEDFRNFLNKVDNIGSLVEFRNTLIEHKINKRYISEEILTSDNVEPSDIDSYDYVYKYFIDVQITHVYDNYGEIDVRSYNAKGRYLVKFYFNIMEGSSIVVKKAIFDTITGNSHPHVSSNGDLCFGNINHGPFKNFKEFTEWATVYFPRALSYVDANSIYCGSCLGVHPDIRELLHGVDDVDEDEYYDDEDQEYVDDYTDDDIE